MLVSASLFAANARSGVGGGVGCKRRFVAMLASGVIAVRGTVAIFGVSGSAKDSFVCRTTLESVSFAVVTLVCLVFTPLLGDGLLLAAPLWLRRFEFLAMVDCFVGSVQEVA